VSAAAHDFRSTRRTFLKSASALAALSATRAGAAQRASAPLRALATRRNVFCGAATANYQLADADFAAAFAQESGMIVPEYELKRFLVEPQPGAFDFSAGDALWKFAQSHGQNFRGHPLVWHAANPDWLEDKVLSTRDERLLSDYVERVAGHFRGRIHSWDVVNEALRPEDGLKDGYRNSLWFKAFGPSYIDMAFHAARAADPQALLVYNDFGCEAGETENDIFRAETLKLLEGLLARKVPLDAYGMQGHLAAYGPAVDQRKLRAFLDDVRAMGLKLIVTEHDVDDSNGPDDIASRDLAVADASRRFLEVLMDSPNLLGVLTWGLSDRYLHVPGMSALLFQRGLRRLPLDSSLARTPMWNAMAQSFSA
jgi:endo-1,4-beta-xylanase